MRPRQRPKPSPQGSLERRWWSLFLDGAEIAKDGSVKGWKAAWDRMTPEAQAVCNRYQCWALVKIDRDGRDADECLSSSVKACRRELTRIVPSAPVYPQVEAVKKLVTTILRGMG